MEHVSVLKKDVQKYMGLKGEEVVVDATLGLGGHALNILEAVGNKGKLIAFEQDERNMAEAKRRLKAYGKQVFYIQDNFRYLKKRITDCGIDQVDAVLFDLGLSSPHVEDSGRGFSFMKDGPLDMRFSLDGELTAYDVVNSYREEDLARIFFEYGEERLSRKVARAIVCDRKVKPFESTVEFAQFLERVLPRKFSKKGVKSHPATKIFQAIRIEVNDELNALKEALAQVMEVLKVNGRVVVISYHSLEDRIVKQFFRALERPPVSSPEEGLYCSYGEPVIKILTKKPVIPSQKEVLENPRSRSAKLRAGEKIKEIS